MTRSARGGPGRSRRWLVVLALFVVTYSMATPLAAYGVFLPVLAESFGWSRGAVSAAISINLLVGGLAGFALGSLADRWGPRAILVVTVALAGSAFALVSVVRELWQLHLLVGLLGGVGMSTFYLLSATTVTRWFDARRGLALALVLVGFNLGYISAGPVAAWLIAEVGWRWAYALMAGGSGLVAALAALTVRLPRGVEAGMPEVRGGAAARGGGEGRADRGEAGLTLAEALADPRQWSLNLAWLLQGALGLMISVHIVPFTRDQGVGLAGASLALTAYGLGAVSGRIIAGTLSDRLGARATIRAAYAVQALGLGALLLWPSPGVRFGALVAVGIGFAASDTMIVRVIPDVFGIKAIGAIMGVFSLGWRFGAALGPTVAGVVYDATGSYASAFGAAPLAVLASWACFSFATSRRRGPVA